MRLLISAVTYDSLLRAGMCQLELVPTAQKYDLAGVEFRPYWRSPIEELPTIKDFMREYGLICTYATYEGLLADNEENTRRSHQSILKSLKFTEYAGARILRINISYDNKPFNPKIMDEPWWNQSVKEVIAMAKEKRIILALENSPLKEAGSPEFLLEIINRFNSPQLRITFNNGNWVINGYDEFEALKLLEKHIIYVHLKDLIKNADGQYESTVIGAGELDVKGLASKVRQTGYRGLYALELPGGKSPGRGILNSVKHLMWGAKD